MTKADIVEQVSDATGLTKVETEAVLDGVIFYIIDSLKRDKFDVLYTHPNLLFISWEKKKNEM